MMIKKAPVRVRTTPRRSAPLRPRAPLPSPPSPPPAILLPLLLSRFSPLHFSLFLFFPAQVADSLFFRRLISARSFPPSPLPLSLLRRLLPLIFFLFTRLFLLAVTGLSRVSLHRGKPSPRIVFIHYFRVTDCFAECDN